MLTKRLVVVMTTMTAAIGSMVLPAVPVNAQSGMPPMMRRDPLDIYKEAGINKVQEDKMRVMIKTFQDMAQAKSKVMAALRDDMRSYSLQATPDEKKVLSKQGEVNNLNSTMSLEQIKLMLNLRKVMTPEQRQKLVKIMQTPPPMQAPTMMAPPVSTKKK